AGSGPVQAQQQNQDYGPGYGQDYGPEGQGWFCPWCGQGRGYGQGPGMQGRGGGQDYGQGYRRGQGMMGGQGYGMGPGMMQDRRGRGYGMGPGMRGDRGGRGYGRGQGMRGGQWGRGQSGPYGGQQQMDPLNKNQARDLVENYVAGNPNLQVGEVRDQEDAYLATIVTRDGSLVEKILIDKDSGWMKQIYD
ncbi:MAG: hypothetical protein K9K64_14465, partial [Desulfohalobiaceae bacterium]|nr:hypothetical protein [Desulfohalobiaceae bacterium]